MRVRCFTQDDAHIFMEPHQVKQEIIGVIELADYFYRLFDFTYEVELSTALRTPWGLMRCGSGYPVVRRSARELEVDYRVNPGEGAFYGQRLIFISVIVWEEDGSVELFSWIFAMPEKFDLYYIGEDGNRHRPVMLHRTVLGSIERFQVFN